MRLIAVSFIVAISTVAISSSASAQSRSLREKALSQCIAFVQSNSPQPVDAADPQQNARLNMYKSCMKKLGYRP
ncbi:MULTISPECIES: hypothetical protein [unclassified Beijerinckia]|uniref:hypothetical protein n=1 Tax=unclassified Beijerinckia TaxID=2638183 RepID=UPI000894FE3C|nr:MULTISPECIES: hypothetical protein [unclassified Beijerinckia]MDH7795167.1 hypothetical protein [Beijerinckia sp. GAS462]SEB90369.1 hypothetical protein SAMN05443249_1441 [Beijerinckia sp. 28-YEA-48]